MKLAFMDIGELGWSMLPSPLISMCGDRTASVSRKSLLMY